MHPLLAWVQPLLKWGVLQETVGKEEAAAVLWPRHGDRVAWIEKGTSMLTQCRVAGNTSHALVQLIGSGAIDAQEVERLLTLQGWEHATLGEYDYDDKDNTEYVPLTDSWKIAVGCATVLAHGRFQDCNARANWLNQGLGVFEVTPDDELEDTIASVDASHLAWIQELCSKELWARQTVAQWLVDEPSYSPPWEWVFNEELGNKPSPDFLDSILQALDERGMSQHKHHWEHTLREERLALLELQAPIFFKSVHDLHTMHLSLYGSVPEEFQANKDYCAERAQFAAGTMAITYAGNAESLEASTSPSMGRLFCDEIPSSAF